MIDQKELEAFKAFHRSESEKIRRKRHQTAQKEAAEAEEAAKLLGLANQDTHLHQMIQNHGKQRIDSLITSLEMKYGPKKSKKPPSSNVASKKKLKSMKNIE
jgi:hypothetical protein